MKTLKVNYKSAFVTAAIATFVFGLAVHMFGLNNTLHNYDDVGALPQGVGATLSSGRWFLLILKLIGSVTVGNYNVPWLDGLTFLILLSVASAFLVLTLNVKNRFHAALIGLVFVSFPTTTVTLFFKFTAPQYGLAILLSVLAVWVTDKWKYGFLAAVCLLAMSLGTYQAYFPLAVTIAVLLIIKTALSADATPIAVLKKGLLHLGTLVGGLVAYFVALKVLLAVGNITLTSYQGLDSMGQLQLADLPQMLLGAFKNVLMLPISDYCSLATTPVLRFLYLVSAVLSVGLIVVWFIQKKRNVWLSLMVCGLFLVLPICVNLIMMMGASTIYTLMVMPFFLLICTPLLLWESVLETASSEKMMTFARRVIVAVALMFVFFNSYIANVNYSSLYYSTRQTENFYSSVAEQVHATEGYDTDKAWMFVGEVDETYFNQPIWAGKHRYGGNSPAREMVNAYSSYNWTRNYLGHRYKEPDDRQREVILKSPEFEAMPNWPNNGSIQVIGECVVIKLSAPVETQNAE